MNKRVLLTGATGLLGKELTKLCPEIIGLSHSELEINNFNDCKFAIERYKPDVIIHAAAKASPVFCESDVDDAIQTNVLGTLNMLKAANNIRFIYISTDYVFDGKKGNYKVDDGINPINVYAKTKAAAEILVRTYKNTLSIRTSFCPRPYHYDKAFIDKWTIRDYVDVIAPKILNAALSDRVGIVHIGTNRKTIYELAKQTRNVNPCSITNEKIAIPQDTSLGELYED